MGRSITEVVLAFNFPRSTVSRVYREYLAGITSHGGQRSGRPRMLNDEDLKRLDSIVCANRYATLDEITAAFNAGGTKQVSRRSVQRCLASMGYVSRRPTRVPVEITTPVAPENIQPAPQTD